MVHCWEEYMWNVHKAITVDPWATNVQLLDVLIQEGGTSLWLPQWLHKNKAPMSRVGSMLTLAFQDPSNQKFIVKNAVHAVAHAAGGGAINNNGAAATSDNSLPNNSDANTIKSGSDTAGLTNAINNINDRETPAQSQHINKSSDNSMESIYNTLLMSKASYSMPDIQVSISSSTSLLSSISITAGASASGQFDAKGSKNVSCNVSGVKSQRVDVDALMELVTPRTCGRPALWRPNISLPQLQWPRKRGQSLWVVTEIMYANMIKMEGEKQQQANATTKVSKGAEEVGGSEQASVEQEGVWTVTAPKDNPTFPFALRLQRLNYDARGSLMTTKNKEPLKRNNSLINKITRQLSSKRVDALYRSSSVSQGRL